MPYPSFNQANSGNNGTAATLSVTINTNVNGANVYVHYIHMLTDGISTTVPSWNFTTPGDGFDIVAFHAAQDCQIIVFRVRGDKLQPSLTIDFTRVSGTYCTYYRRSGTRVSWAADAVIQGPKVDQLGPGPILIPPPDPYPGEVVLTSYWAGDGSDTYVTTAPLLDGVAVIPGTFSYYASIRNPTSNNASGVAGQFISAMPQDYTYPPNAQWDSEFFPVLSDGYCGMSLLIRGGYTMGEHIEELSGVQNSTFNEIYGASGLNVKTIDGVPTVWVV